MVQEQNKKYIKIQTNEKVIWTKRSNSKPIETQEYTKMTQKEPKTGKIENLYGLKYWTHPVERIKRKNKTDETLMAESDGSVRNGTQGGTWAWSIIEYDKQVNLNPMGIIGRGREKTPQLDTQMTHSYRMEALGLLSLMTYARYDLQWKGEIDLHMDNKGVIQTYTKCGHWTQPQWVKQSDKDVWEAIAREKREYWNN